VLKHGHRVLPSGYKVRIDDKNGAMPDIQMFTDAEWRRAPNEGLNEGRPTLAVEVISPTSRAHDRVRKLNGYASIEVPEYWIIDGEAQTLERLTLSRGHYVLAQVVAADEIFRPTRFKGLKIPLRQLWDV
jgi:Uma2 family endonuclease